MRPSFTTIDLPAADLDRAGRLLETIGVKPPYYPVSAVTGEGLEALRSLPELRRVWNGEPAGQSAADRT